MNDHASDKRDQRLRRRVLLFLKSARINEGGWVSGRFMYDLINGVVPPSQQFEGDDHLLGLMRDLVGAGYAEERDNRSRKGQRYELDWLSFRITPKGSALTMEQIPPDPLVEDDRLRVS